MFKFQRVLIFKAWKFSIAKLISCLEPVEDEIFASYLKSFFFSFRLHVPLRKTQLYSFTVIRLGKFYREISDRFADLERCKTYTSQPELIGLCLLPTKNKLDSITLFFLLLKNKHFFKPSDEACERRFVTSD